MEQRIFLECEFSQFLVIGRPVVNPSRQSSVNPTVIPEHNSERVISCYPS